MKRLLARIFGRQGGEVATTRRPDGGAGGRMGLPRRLRKSIPPLPEVEPEPLPAEPWATCRNCGQKLFYGTGLSGVMRWGHWRRPGLPVQCVFEADPVDIRSGDEELAKREEA